MKFSTVRFLTLTALSCIITQGATIYCGPSRTGSGSGTDWSNQAAFPSLTLVRGNTYYLANGSYGSKTFNISTSGSTLITIKKAVAGDHGTDTGWSPTYGDGQAAFTSWSISSSYWFFDGQTGGGPGSWDNGHGLRVAQLGDHVITVSNSAGNLTFRHIDVDGTSTANLDRDLFYLVPTGSNITMQYMYLHDVGCDMFQIRGTLTNFTLEYSKLARNNSSAGGCHGDVFEYDEGAASGWVHRYNWFDDTVGTYLWGTHESGTFSNNNIYGNIISGGLFSNGMVGALSGGGTITNLHFYNNTVVNVAENAGFIYLERGTNNLIYNNLWYNSSPRMQGSHDYNAFYNAGSQSETHIQTGSGTPFQSLATDDYRLTGATTAGLPLSGYDIDMLGRTRGADGTWDRGAYEYGPQGATSPTPPSNVVTVVR